MKTFISDIRYLVYYMNDNPEGWVLLGLALFFSLLGALAVKSIWPILILWTSLAIIHHLDYKLSSK